MSLTKALEALPETPGLNSADKKLFETLDRAYDASMDRVSGTESEPLPGVGEEMLSAGGKTGAAKPLFGESVHQTDSVRA